MSDEASASEATDLPIQIDGPASPPQAEPDEIDDQPVIPLQFAICNAKTASWLCQKVNEARSYAKNVADWAAREIKRAERDEAFLLMRYGRQLEEWAANEIARLHGRRRSVSLPGGTVGFRTSPAQLVIDDEGAVIAWAQQHKPELVKVIARLSKTALNEHVEQTGEIPDVGVHVEPASEKFYLK